LNPPAHLDHTFSPPRCRRHDPNPHPSPPRIQEDSDLAYFDIDMEGIRARCAERGDIKHVRFPIRDFDPFDLRRKLPKAVARLAAAHQPKVGIAYIHCTAGESLEGLGFGLSLPVVSLHHVCNSVSSGTSETAKTTRPPIRNLSTHPTPGLGRAPATALAYMHWLRGWHLQEAYEHLTGTRTCSPRIEAIRAATADLLTGTGPIPITLSLQRRGTAKSVQIAGLDVGWHQRIDLAEHPVTKRLEVTRELLPGSYPFKFVIDDVWSASQDYPSFTVRAGIFLGGPWRPLHARK
jgi:hypothetical protein